MSRKMKGLSKWGKLLYGLCLMGGNFVYMITATYVTTYYNVYLGIPAAFVGLILMIARIFDAVNDPLSGIIVQKVHFRGGKYRPFLLSGSIINGMILVALFAVPHGIQTSDSGKMVWFAVAYLMWSITYDMFDIPIWSVIPAVTEEGAERENLASIGRSFAGIGCGIVSALGLTLASTFGGGTEYANYIVGFRWLAVIIFAYYVISTVLFCRELKGKDDRTADEEESVSVIDMFRSLLHNNQAIVVAIAIVITNFAVYFSTSFLQYYMIFDFDQGKDYNADYAMVTAVMFVAQVIGMAVIYPLIKKVLKRKALFVGSLILAIFGYAILLFMTASNVTNLFLLLMPCAVIGLVTGILNVLTTVFLADATDFGEYLTGRREESVICSMQTFVVKLASGLSAGASGLLLTLIGFNTAEGAVNSASALNAMHIAMSGVPTLFLAAGIVVFILKFTLDEKKMKEISAALRNRRENGDKKNA